MHVLIVEDEQELRESLEELFEDEGFVVSTAENGADALAQLQNASQLPCCMILDLLMPVLNGIELYAEMKQDARLADLPIIVTTSDPSRAPEGLLIMKKPINLERLVLAVRQYCQ